MDNSRWPLSREAVRAWHQRAGEASGRARRAQRRVEGLSVDAAYRRGYLTGYQRAFLRWQSWKRWLERTHDAR